jgi:hypothetical protein
LVIRTPNAERRTPNPERRTPNAERRTTTLISSSVRVRIAIATVCTVLR